MSERAERMVERTPAYYQYSAIFYAIQKAIADDLDNLNTKQDTIGPQLYILTATWGLRYWEEILGLPTILTDSYDVRRSRVLAAWRGIGNFGVDLIKAIISAYTHEPVRVWLAVAAFEVVIEIPSEFPDFSTANTQISNIIHAHLGIKYRIRASCPFIIGQNPKTSLHLTDKTNFWTRLASASVRWDGSYSWDGGLAWKGHEDLTGTEFLTAQRHVVVFRVGIQFKAQPGVGQKWDGATFFGGTRTWGSFVPTEKFKNDILALTKKVGASVVERAVL